MRLFPSLIPVSDIACNISGRFSPDQLRRAAQLILSGDGIISPLIVRQISFDRYELVDGVFEYQAAVEAKKLDPMRGELINAYIVHSGEEHIIAEQVAMFRRGEKSEPGVTPSIQSVHQTAELLREFETLIRVQEGRFEVVLNKALQAMGEQLRHSTAIIEAKTTPAEPDAVSAVVELKPTKVPDSSEFKVHAQAEKKVAVLALEGHASLSEESAFMDFLNRTSQRELQDLRSRVPHKAINLLLNQRNKRLFESQEDCLSRVRGKGFADASYDRIFDMWKKKHAATASGHQGVRSQKSSTGITQATTVPAKRVSKRRQVAQPAMQSTMLPPISAAVASPKVALNGIDKFNAMDTGELTLTLNRMRLSKRLIAAVVKQRPFDSFDAMEISGLGASRKEKLKMAFA